MNYLMNIFFRSYKNSRHRAIYEMIAVDLGTTPQDVYNLAHGMRPQYHIDELIINQLLSHRIIGSKY